MTIDQIINKVKDNYPKADTDVLKFAYEYAEKAHQGQKRKTGEPYIEHCLQTAYLLAQIKADITTVAAGILHDVPEDTDRTIEEIREYFGTEIAFLVEGITKLSKIKYRGAERYRESLRKMFLAMASDLRVILIKFCDRLHNLRTLDGLAPEKRIRIAQETMEIYAPIAGLLGIWRLKWQMEDICFKYLQPEQFKELEYEYEVEKRTERNQFINKVKEMLGRKLKENGISHDIEGRFKHLYSIYRKMKIKGKKFNEIYDVFALRIITVEISDCYKTMGVIHSLWKPMPERIKDYIAVPKPNGYRSLHTTVFGPDNKITEFQIRTMEMHEESLYGVAAHWRYKRLRGDEAEYTKQPAWMKELMEIQKGAKTSTEFVNEMKLNIFHNRIFVFTPKGDVIDLPENATPIDFAYKVHSEIGNRATAALINNKMASLEQYLKNGDMVEIITDKNRKMPNRDWLNTVKTHGAREKIKQATNISNLEKIKRIITGGKFK